ncbi:hypothetical protein B0H16DRAFT_1624657, partial [Mycena metata]
MRDPPSSSSKRQPNERTHRPAINRRMNERTNGKNEADRKYCNILLSQPTSGRYFSQTLPTLWPYHHPSFLLTNSRLAINSKPKRLHFMILFHYYFFHFLSLFFPPFAPTIHPRYAPLRTVLRTVYLSILFCQLSATFLVTFTMRD